MECTKLQDVAEKIGYTGVCIGAERVQLLRNSLLTLQNENHFRKTYYWGRINGTDNDYHIAFGYAKDCLKDRRFFYSLDCLDWFLLPRPTKCGKLLTPLSPTLFDGNPSIVTNISKNPAFSAAKNRTEFGEGPPQFLKEEDRLSATVEFITEESLIIPRGAWCRRPDGSTTENNAFEGLDPIESLDQKSYLHARFPKEKWTENLLTRNDYNYSLDFLDPTSIDIPGECWNIQRYLGSRLIILQNLYWPGMTFYHIPESPHHGFLYIGYGMKNINLPFML
ncbi:radial spoke head protein 9 homolog [Fopius arisanus]|uniref:Radial spoke head protein 9 homolog n=1 Tax=Fopius arisanus TaxID=64838 RepID=A0A9R1TYR1_9HYME|nr:PREDICTED: radial spoke head protein 9 homolog [Fopius arisanus]